MLNCFGYWCQRVLPAVFDESLSYYELLCKVIDYINKLIEQDKVFAADITQLKQEISIIQQWIDNFNTDYIADLIAKYIATMIFVEITNSGYIVYYIPENWNDITFNTTGLDIQVSDMPEYGHLVLSY